MPPRSLKIFQIPGPVRVKVMNNFISLINVRMLNLAAVLKIYSLVHIFFVFCTFCYVHLSC